MRKGRDFVKIKTIGRAILLGFLVLALGACGTLTKTDAGKYVDINDVVKEAFVTDKGFSEELSKHMDKEVFDKVNIYNAYPVNSPEFKKPLKVDFSLREIAQKKVDTLSQKGPGSIGMSSILRSAKVYHP